MLTVQLKDILEIDYRLGTLVLVEMRDCLGQMCLKIASGVTRDLGDGNKQHRGKKEGGWHRLSGLHWIDLANKSQNNSEPKGAKAANPAAVSGSEGHALYEARARLF